MEIVDHITPGNKIMTDFENDKGKVFEEVPSNFIRNFSKIRQEKFSNKEWIPREPQFEIRPTRNLNSNAYNGENVLEQIKTNSEISQNCDKS